MVTSFGSSLTAVTGKFQTLDDNVFGTRAAEVKLHRTDNDDSSESNYRMEHNKMNGKLLIRSN